MEEKKTPFIDKLGPTLTSGLLVAALSAASLGAVALRDLVIVTNVDFANLKSEFARHRLEFEQFRTPGARFTADDGKRLQSEIDELEVRLRHQETRPPRVGTVVEKLEERVHGIELKQAEICERIRNCNGYPSTGYPGTNRSGNQSPR